MLDELEGVARRPGAARREPGRRSSHEIKDGALPTWHVKVGGQGALVPHAEEVDEFRQAESQRLGKDLVVDDTDEAPAEDAETRLVADEFHEVRAINRALAKLAEYGFEPSDLVPAPRIAGREPPVRYVLEHGDMRQAAGPPARAGGRGPRTSARRA